MTDGKEKIDRRSFLGGCALGASLGGILGFGMGGFVGAWAYIHPESEPDIAARYHHVVDEETSQDVVQTSHDQGVISVSVRADLTQDSPMLDSVSDLISTFQNGYLGYYDYHWESVHKLKADIWACGEKKYSFSYHVDWFGASMYEKVEEENGLIPEFEKTEKHDSERQSNWDCETWGESQ